MSIKNCEGYKNLKSDLLRATKGRCTNIDGCNVRTGACFGKPCNKFRWAVDRAIDYAKKTRINARKILDAWEMDRDYHFRDYYSESHQPLLMDDVRIFESEDSLRESIRGNGFRCPVCGDVSTNPYVCDTYSVVDGEICSATVGESGTVTIFLKSNLKGEKLFMPIAWE